VWMLSLAWLVKGKSPNVITEVNSDGEPCIG
jgi:hypothetical protein